MKGTAHLYNGVNATFTTDRFQNEKSAIRLTYGYYQVPAGVYFSGDFTISVWIRLNKLVSWARIIDFGNGAYSNNVILSTSNISTGQPILILYNGTISSSRVSTLSALKIGLWTNIAFSLNRTTAKIYLNGTFSALDSFLRPTNMTRVSNYVGKSNFPNNENLNADLDDLMIFDRSLSDSEIIELMKVNSLITSTSTALSTLTSSTTTTTSTTSSTSSSTTVKTTTNELMLVSNTESFSTTSTSFATTTAIIISCVSILILFLLTILIYFSLKAINKINKIKQVQIVSNARDIDVISLTDNSLIPSTSTSL